MKLKMNNVDGSVGEIDLAQSTVTLTDENGRLVTMDLGPADVHIESGLQNYCAGYKLIEGIADLVAPIVPVPKASDKYWTWDSKDAFQDVEALVSGSTDNPREVSPRLGNTTFTTKPYCLAAPVPVEVISNADAPVRPEIAAIRRVMSALTIARERRVAAKLMTAGNWGTRTGAVTAKWNGGANSDPIRDIYSAIDLCPTAINQLVMSRRTYHDFVQNAQVQKYIASKTMVQPINEATNAGASNLTALLGLPPVTIGAMQGLVTNLTTHGYVWGDNVALCYNEPGIPADGQSVNTMKTFRWTGADGVTPDGTVNGGFLVRKYFDPRRGSRGAYVYVVVVNDAEELTSTLAGYLLTGAHA